MNDWSHTEVLKLVGLFAAIVACVASVFVVPEFRRLIGLDRSLVERDILILTPKSPIIVSADEAIAGTIKKRISGEVIGFTRKELDKRGLKVVIWIKTDQWYSQDTVSVQSNGRWSTNKGIFTIEDGLVHIIRVRLDDKDGELMNRETEVAVAI